MKPINLLGNVLVACVMLAGAARAEPALWVAYSATATVYFLGTVHLLKHDTS